MSCRSTGLGRKSVACILLLCLRAHDFPVDTNVGRICARMGWLPFDQEKPLEVGCTAEVLQLKPTTTKRRCLSSIPAILNTGPSRT